jgi:hypothetical protein
VKDKKPHLHIAYDIAWEYSSLGETSIAHSYLVDACHVGSQIFTLRSTMTTNTSESRLVLRTSPCTRQSQPVQSALDNSVGPGLRDFYTIVEFTLLSFSPIQSTYPCTRGIVYVRRRITTIRIHTYNLVQGG